MKVLTLSLLSLLVLAFHTQAQVGGGAYFQRQLDKAGPPNEGPKPDYTNTIYWAATPFRENESSYVPEGVAKNDSSKAADVFFIHPTTYLTADGTARSGTEIKKRPLKALKALKDSPWNADLRNQAINLRTDSLTMKNQASVFNGCARIFAPRYRQACIKAFMVPETSPNAQQAFDLAYSDVKAAFQYYLDHYNGDRPIIIAAHSQGSLMAIRLLKEFFDGKPLQRKLVCAYVIGHPIAPNTFTSIPVGAQPRQTVCVVGWQSFNADGQMSDRWIEVRGNSLAVNPMTWKADTVRAPENLSQGVLTPSGKLIAGKIACQLDKYGFLQVTTPPAWDEWLKGANNLHVLDYNLFWMNIRTNAAERIAAYYKP